MSPTAAPILLSGTDSHASIAKNQIQFLILLLEAVMFVLKEQFMTLLILTNANQLDNSNLILLTYSMPYFDLNLYLSFMYSILIFIF